MGRKQKGKYLKKRRLKKKRGMGILWVVLPVGLAILAAVLLFRPVTDYRSQRRYVAMAKAVHAIEGEISEPVGATAPTAAIPGAVTAPTAPPPSVPGEEPNREEPQPEQEVLPQYADLYGENPDLFGWLQIEGTVVDYPVMHTPYDPEKYLHTDFHGKYSYGGALFLDAKCSPDSDNLLIYGHNMSDGSMFGKLIQYEAKDYWRSHPVIRFDTLYAQGEYEVVAAFYDRVYYTHEDCFKFYRFIDAADRAEYADAVAILKGKSLYDTGVTAEYGQQLITLVTCAYHVDNGRFVVVARKK